ncbi:MAG: ROK family protein [Erysipelotrichaceae bacterium]|nr:ROK family protein [Erysipelotrichaceae bacterium]
MSILAVDVGGTFIKWASADEYTFLKSGKAETPRTCFEDFINKIEELVNEYHPEGIAFSLPGTMDPETGFISQGGALQYNNGKNLIEECRTRFHLPASIENDARCAALSEAETGALRDTDFGIVLVIGTGIGGAFVHNGQILRGSHGYAGEMSLFLAGSLKKEGTGAFFSSRCAMADFTKTFRKQLGCETMTGEEFMKLVRENDSAAVRLFDEYTDEFANALFSIQMMYDPARIVIGGGISEDAFYIQSIRDKFEAMFAIFPFPISRAQICACSNANNANLTGALANYYRRHQIV